MIKISHNLNIHSHSVFRAHKTELFVPLLKQWQDRINNYPLPPPAIGQKGQQCFFWGVKKKTSRLKETPLVDGEPVLLELGSNKHR